MKNKSARPLAVAAPSEEAIRDYAYHLYVQGDRTPGQDLAHWFEATAFLTANNPPRWNGAHHHRPIKEPNRSELSIGP